MSTDTRDVMSAIQRLRPCSESERWVKSNSGTPRELWARCERGDWLLWLAARAGVDRRRIVLAAADCAELAAPQWTPETEMACIWAVDAARRWARGETDLEEVRAAYDAAYAAAAYAYAAYAYAAAAYAYAAYAAAAYAAAAYAYAAYAYAADAAYAAAAAARSTTLNGCADIVRRHICWSDVERLLLQREAV